MRFDITHFEDCMKGSCKLLLKLIYAMSTIENHSFENESEIKYIVKWFKAHNLVLTGKHILTCSFLPKTMLSMKYDPLAQFAIVRRRFLKNWWKMNDKWWFLVRVSGKAPDTRRTLSLASSFFTGFKNKAKKGASSVKRYLNKSAINKEPEEWNPVKLLTAVELGEFFYILVKCQELLRSIYVIRKETENNSRKKMPIYIWKIT